jgi:para-nitrobenzyl esterase
MVFLHGGGFLVGSGAEHDATRLVDQGDVVVVTVNYRLGPLGFLDHPALDDPAAGNYALADQQTALRWIRQNIAAFGGDPANVTLWGQSAGAFSTCAQFAAPSARGLFDKAIVQSGPCGATMLTRPKAQARALAYAEVAGCAGSSAAACLRGLPGQALIAATRLGGTLPAKLTDLAWTPVVGTSLLPRQPLKAIRAGAADGIPLVQGGTREEMRSFVAGSYAANPLTAERYPDAVREIYGQADAAAILARYRPEQYATPGVALATVLTDDGSLMGTCRQLSANDAITTKTVFAYEFAQPSGRSIGDFPLGAYHSSDVRYLLDTSNPYAPPPLTPEEEPLGEEMIRHWSTFARSGHPAPGWPHYAHGRGLSFALDNTDVVDLGREHLCGFWRDRVPISDQD